MQINEQQNIISQPHDRVFKLAMHDVRVVIDMIKAYLPVSFAQLLNLDTLQLCNNDYIDKEYDHSQSDILYSVECHAGGGYVYLLWEHQSSYDKKIPLRFLAYSCRIMEQHLKQGHADLPLVIPILVYNGINTPYPGSPDFMTAFYNESLAREYMFKAFYLLDLTVISDEQLLQSQWSAFPNILLKHMRCDDFTVFIQQLRHIILNLYNNNGEILVGDMLECVSRNVSILDRAEFIALAQQLSTDIGDKMATLQQQWETEGRLRGRADGIGVGRVEGIEIGRSEGLNLAMSQTIMKLLHKGLSHQQISELLDLPIDKLKSYVDQK